jgi:elongation factor P
MANIRATDIRKGIVLKIDNELYVVHQMDHVTPGKGQAVVQTKLRSLSRKNLIPKRFNASESVEQVDLNTKWAQYIYDNPDEAVFMDGKTYEQFNIPKADIEEELKYISHDDNVEITFHGNDPISIELPASVVLEVVEAEPAVRGNTATNVTKNVTLNTGLVVKAPPHINVGEKVKIDTRTGEFLERSKE